MAKKSEELPCSNKLLEFTRPVLIDLNRLSDEDFYILEDLRKDCSNIHGYKHEYALYKEMKDAFILRVGSMGLKILVRNDKCIVIEIVQLVELN